MKRWLLSCLAIGIAVSIYLYSTKNNEVKKISVLNTTELDTRPLDTSALIDISVDEHKNPSTKSRGAFLRHPAKEVTGNALQNIAQYKSAALRGDGEAAFMIYQVLAKCTLQAESTTSNVTDIDCVGITSEQKAETEKFLKLSAEANFLEAQISYAGVASTKYEKAKDVAANLKEFQQYRQDSMRYLNSAASTGSIEAMQQMSDAYKYGFITEKNNVRAYAYMYAVNSSGLLDPSLNNAVLDQMRAEMTESEVQQATAIGNTIYKRCCTN